MTSGQTAPKMLQYKPASPRPVENRQLTPAIKLNKGHFSPLFNLIMKKVFESSMVK